jgi:hypothetical protein
MRIDYYGNMFDDRGQFLGTDYYQSQAWRDAKTASDAWEAARDAALAAQYEAERNPTPTNVAVAQTAADAVIRTNAARSQIGTTPDRPDLNAELVRETVIQANRALDAVGADPLPVPPPRSPEDPMFPGVPPRQPSSDPNDPINQPAAEDSLGALVRLAIGSYFAFRLFS